MKYKQKAPENIRDVTEGHYEDLVSQGYRWDTNVSNQEAEALAQRKRAEGLDIFVGDFAFIPKPVVGGFTRDSNAKAILVRETPKG